MKRHIYKKFNDFKINKYISYGNHSIVFESVFIDSNKKYAMKIIQNDNELINKNIKTIENFIKIVNQNENFINLEFIVNDINTFHFERDFIYNNIEKILLNNNYVNNDGIYIFENLNKMNSIKNKFVNFLTVPNYFIQVMDYVDYNFFDFIYSNKNITNDKKLFTDLLIQIINIIYIINLNGFFHTDFKMNNIGITIVPKDTTINILGYNVKTHGYLLKLLDYDNVITNIPNVKDELDDNINQTLKKRNDLTKTFHFIIYPIIMRNLFLKLLNNNDSYNSYNKLYNTLDIKIGKEYYDKILYNLNNIIIKEKQYTKPFKFQEFKKIDVSKYNIKIDNNIKQNKDYSMVNFDKLSYIDRIINLLKNILYHNNLSQKFNLEFDLFNFIDFDFIMFYFNNYYNIKTILLKLLSENYNHL